MVSHSVLILFLIAYAASLLTVVRCAKLAISSDDAMPTRSNLSIIVTIVVGLLRLGGMPPLVGFYGKLVAIRFILGALKVTIAALLVSTSIVLLYVYLRFRFRSLILLTYVAPVRRVNVASVVVPILVLLLPPTIGLLRDGVCTGNFGFPGLIILRHVSTL